MLPHEPLTARIIGAAFHVYNVLGPGHLEHVYRNALALLLRREGLEVRTEVSVPVEFEGSGIGRCEADLMVEHIVVVETKAWRGIKPENETRLEAYLRSSGHELGLLLNFGPKRVEIKRIVETRIGRATA
jgi:GxxExxY protein